ncbi:hypothetical protein RFI_31813 [Reticulomyxa filosa]|uniref:Uncharacterized protein n=1 Tax=Reticulomyxa filosa TaxID=46433 RepID=X6LWR4_RETFI|nr:hypothetical protein RFI_31813 [Reticulomyxa filosa]|eukprot:ETO05582.1 hypothetical protein RFI_31813 [Reticulomyxa filosa]
MKKKKKKESIKREKSKWKRGGNEKRMKNIEKEKKKKDNNNRSAKTGRSDRGSGSMMDDWICFFKKHVGKISFGYMDCLCLETHKVDNRWSGLFYIARYNYWHTELLKNSIAINLGSKVFLNNCWDGKAPKSMSNFDYSANKQVKLGCYGNNANFTNI